nr:dual specificity protein phosphatase 12 [Quercus suber]
MPYRVRENLFISNISDAAEILQKGSTEITHILSVLSSVSISFFSEWRSNLVIPAKEIKKVYAGGGGGGDGCSGSVEEDSIADGGSKSPLSPDKILYSLEYAGKDLKLVRMAVPIRDMESEDLLDYLDVCFDFIDRNRKEGSVLVHCFAGVSRSAAIITAYLMRTEHLSQEDALESLKQSCEFVCPNDGFIEQLKMFEEMGFKVDRASPIYKRFRLKVLGESYNRGEKIESSKFGADPGLATEVSSEGEVASNLGNNHTPAYRCKKCRRVVALQENVVDHIPGEGETSFEWRKRKSGNPYNKSEESECSSIFVEPLQWMTAVKEGAMEGKLSCAHCEGRLGFFNCRRSKLWVECCLACLLPNVCTKQSKAEDDLSGGGEGWYFLEYYVFSKLFL